jgi:hypothetical protein
MEKRRDEDSKSRDLPPAYILDCCVLAPGPFNLRRTYLHKVELKSCHANKPACRECTLGRGRTDIANLRLSGKMEW